jgi:hypothetical protein
MLIVLNGSETIKKATIAWTIIQELNSIHFTDTNYQQLLDDNTNNQLKMQFRAIWSDFGLSTDNIFPEGGNYQTLLDRYQNRPYPILVICGSFSKTFVNMVTRDITNTKVINIIRNPSTIYLIDSITLDRAPYNLTTGVKLLKQRNESSFVQSVLLSQLLCVQTIKFEDILINGGIDIDGHYIKLPDYKSYNGIITQHEHQLLIPECSIEDQDLEKFNYLASNFRQVLPNGRADIPTELADQLPINLFESLNYQPLTYQEITCLEL